MATTSDKSARPTIVRSNEYREFVATNFGLRTNDNLCELIFAFQTARDDQDVVQEQAKAILTPRSLKTVWVLLSEAIRQFEAKHGEIELKGTKIKELAKGQEKEAAG
jgi:hypothetical protein